MSPGRLDADVDGYRLAGAANTPPPMVSSDPLAGGLTPIEQLVRVLGLAANLGDEQDNIDSLADHTERDILTGEAAAAFETQDADAAAEVRGVAAQDPASQMAQQIPQMAAGIAGSLAGALGGAMQQIGQIPQQLTQGANQAMQAGMGMVQQSGLGYPGLEDADSGDYLDELDPLTDDLTAETGDLGGDGIFGGGTPSGGGTTPGAGGSLLGAGGPLLGAGGAAPLAPAAPPSAGTFLSSARSATGAPPVSAGHTPMVGGGMAGVPMMPPAAMNGGGAADKDGPTDTKRVSVPPVRNGAPVQGRITTPPAEPSAVRTVQGKPAATRRIIVTRDGDPPLGMPQGPDPQGPDRAGRR